MNSDQPSVFNELRGIFNKVNIIKNAMHEGPGTNLKYFMWAHQHSTQDNIQRYAVELFGEISPTLKPKVLLIGILRKKIENGYIRYPICMQPQECIDATLFNGIDELANTIWEADPRRNALHGMAYVHENYHNKVKRDSVRLAFQQTIDKCFQGKNEVSFVSEAVEIEGYEVFVVLQFEESAYNSFYALTRTDKFSPRSLLYSLVWVFLRESLQTLYRPRAATEPQSIWLDGKEMLRLAALDFVGSAIFSVCETSLPWEFLDTCNFVSSLKYEGDSSRGTLIVAKEPHPNIEISLKLVTSVNINEYPKIRKLLEIASRDLALYFNGKEILVLCKQKGEYDEKNQDLLTVNFTGQQRWELKHGENTMLIMEYANPSLPKQKIDKVNFDDLLKRVFIHISDDDLDRLWNIVNTATVQTRGTLLIISSEAENESLRLQNQSTKIEPLVLNESLIQNITSIDGATLLDSKGICHSIGVILDGTATKKGKSERGARYNSAVRYVENNKKKCVAVIISEDGMINLYPDLLPRIKKSDIEKNLNELRTLTGEKILDNERYWRVMGWFENHKFYLSQDQCNEINSLKRLCNDKPLIDIYQVFVLWNDLTPNADMDESFFLED
jgi:hypothetical protein